MSIIGHVIRDPGTERVTIRQLERNGWKAVQYTDSGTTWQKGEQQIRLIRAYSVETGEEMTPPQKAEIIYEH